MVATIIMYEWIPCDRFNDIFCIYSSILMAEFEVQKGLAQVHWTLNNKKVNSLSPKRYAQISLKIHRIWEPWILSDELWSKPIGPIMVYLRSSKSTHCQTFAQLTPPPPNFLLPLNYNCLLPSPILYQSPLFPFFLFYSSLPLDRWTTNAGHPILKQTYPLSPTYHQYGWSVCTNIYLLIFELNFSNTCMPINRLGLWQLGLGFFNWAAHYRYRSRKQNLAICTSHNRFYFLSFSAGFLKAATTEQRHCVFRGESKGRTACSVSLPRGPHGLRQTETRGRETDALWLKIWCCGSHPLELSVTLSSFC